MSLTNITFTAQQQANLVVQSRAGLLKVASASAGTLGTVRAEGVSAGTVVGWSLQGNPGTAITISAKAGDPTMADLSFNNVPVQAEPYLMIVQANTQDGKMVQIPLAVVVREAFSILEIAHLPATDGLTVTGQSYDPNLDTLTFKGYGPLGEVPGVRFIPPTSLPQGLSFQVDGNDTAYLRVAQPTLEDPSGGVKASPGTYTVTLKAYREGTLYDTPETAATYQITYNLTSGAKAGDLRFSVGGSYDPTERGVLMDALLAYYGGQAQVHSLEWTVNPGAVGSWASAPTPSTLSAIWKPAGSTVQDVTFTINVKNSGGATVATATVGPLKLTGKDPNADPAENWSSTAACPVVLLPAKLYPQDAGKKVYFKVACPDLVSGETASVTTTITPIGSAAVVSDVPAAINLTDSGKTAILSFTVPPNANPYDMWAVQVGVAVTGGSTPRSGSGRLLAFSKGATPLIVQLANTTLSGNTGSFLSPVTVRAYQWVQNPLPGTPDDTFLNPAPGVWNSTLTEVSGATFTVADAPAGITPTFQVDSGLYQLTGLLTTSGTTNFFVNATKAGFTPAAPVGVSIMGQQSITRLRFTDFSTTNPVVAGGQGFTLTWGYDGSGTITLQKGNTLPPDTVTGSLMSAMQPITTSTVYILRGTNSLGEAFSAPVLVQFGATGSSTQLPPSSAIAVIDENNKLSVAWQPALINGSFSAYHHWILSAKDAPSGVSYALARPGVAVNPTWVDGLGFGGTLDARKFEYELAAGGYHELSMQAFADPSQAAILNSKPWDTYKAFPATRTVTLDKTTASKGEAIAITLGAAEGGTGPTGDRWQAVYSDGTSSDWFPMTITSVAKAFGQGGVNQSIKIVVESDYSTAFPPVKLRRTTTKTIFIQDQDFQGDGDLFDIGNATVGVGGEVGFEVTNNLDGSKAPQPYLVAVPALVRDDITNELKLLVATARGRDASSVLGTMAVDVFPLPGRPHTLDLVNVPGQFLTPEAGVYDPVKITQDVLPDVIVGRNMTSVRLQASGGKRPFRWFATELPVGLQLAVDGTLTGTVMRLGRFPINVSVQDAQNPSSIDNKTLYLTAKSDLSIKTSTVSPAAVGTLYGQALEAQQGVQPYTWDLMAGELPHGLSLGVDGVISGWPVTYHEDDFTPYTFVAQATDAVGAKASRQFQLTLAPMALAIKEPDQATLVQGMGFVLRFPIVGGKPGYSLVGNPTAPTGFVSTCSVVNGAVELVVPEAFSTALTSVPVSLRVRDSLAVEASQTFNIQVAPSIPVTRWAQPTVPVRVSQASAPQTIPTSGTPSGTTFEAVEILPPLTNLTGVADAARGQVRVQPPVTLGGNEEVTFRVTLRQGAITLGKVSREFSVQTLAGSATRDWTVKALPVRLNEFFVLDPLAPGKNATTAPALGTSRLRVAATSALPLGVSLDPVTGHLYGAVRQQTAPGRSVLEIVDASDTVISTIGVDWTVVGTGIQIVGTLPQVDVGQNYTAALQLSGVGANPSVELLHGRLPEGMSLACDATQVTLTGRPRETGYFDLYIRVRDASNQSGLYVARMVVNYRPYLAVLTPAIPKVVEGFAYTFKLQGTGGKAPYTWALAQGSTLPTGITLAADGTLSGTSTDTTFNRAVTFELTDSYGQKVTAALNMTVGAADPLVITTTSLPSGVVGATYVGVQLQVTGGVPGYTWSQVTLPAGLSLDSATGIITGTPTAPFAQDITFSVRDSLNVTTTKLLRLTISTASGFRITTDKVPQGRVGLPLGGGGAVAAALTVAATPEARVGAAYVRVRRGTKDYVLAIGGLGPWAKRSDGAVVAPSGPTAGATDGSYDPAQDTLVSLFDPDTVVNGNRVGAWIPNVALAGFDWEFANPAHNLGGISPAAIFNRAFSTAVSLSDDTFVLIGGAFMHNQQTYQGIQGIQGRSMHPGSDSANTFPTQSGSTGGYVGPIIFCKIVETAPGEGTIRVLAGPQTLPSWGGYGFHAAGATRMKDGRVFIVGGVCLAHQYVGGGESQMQMASVVPAGVDPKASYIMQVGANYHDSIITKVASMPVGLINPKAVTLNDGRIVVLGGLIRTTLQPSNGCFIYNPVTNTWATGPTMPTAEYAHSATVLPDGRVIYGGDDDQGTQAVATPFYVLDPAATTWATLLAPTDYFPNGFGGMVTLRDGTLLYTGGTENAHYSGGQSWLTARPGIYTDGGGLNPLTQLSQVEYSTTQSIAASAGKFGTCFINPGSTNGGSTGIQFEAAGGVLPYQTWTAVQALPNGVTLSATGLLSGTPTDAFEADVTFRVNDSTAPGAGGPLLAEKVLHLSVMDPQAPVWVTNSLPQGYLEAAYSYQLVAKDSLGAVLPGNYSISPNSQFGLPPGIDLSQDGKLTGTTTTGWSRQVTFRVTHPQNPTRFADKTMLLAFVCNAKLDTTVALGVITSTVAYSKQLRATGISSGNAQFSVVSGLPAGLSLSASGLLSGTCTENTPRTGTLTVTATSATTGCADTKAFPYQISLVQWSVSPATLSYTRGLTYVAATSPRLTCSGGNGSYTWSIQGLPTGFTYDTATGAVHTNGTVVTTPVGNYPLTVQVSDSTGATYTTSVTLTVKNPDYTWRSGPMAAGAAWGSAPTGPSDPIPLAWVWERSQISWQGGAITPGQGLMEGCPWEVVVSGVQTANPTMAVLDVRDGSRNTWKATLVSLSGGTAVFRISTTGSPVAATPTANFQLVTTLTDGSATDSRTFQVFYEGANGDLHPRNEHFVDASGQQPPYAYYDLTHPQP